MVNDLSILAAFIAGLLSFLSPCVLPLISSYLMFISGTQLQQGEEYGKTIRYLSPYQFRLLGGTAFFVLGFSCVFIILSILFSGIFFILGGANKIIDAAAGIVVVILGLNILFDFIPFLNYEKRIHPAKRPRGVLDSFIVGVAFGAGWTPCIGPILGSILLMAGQSGKLAFSIGYLLVYSIGLGLPFLIAALCFGSFFKYLEKLKPWRSCMHKISGIFIIGIGVFIMLGRFKYLNAFFLRTGYALGEWAGNGAVRLIPAIIFFIAALIPLVYRMVRNIKAFSWVSVVFCGICMFLSMAQIVGLINCVEILSRWFTFIGV
ncbi:MAG: cytochrome c biogenesis protein CcdA [Treponema sp.]|jgi:cytochrome c-type biogenesis protein|nr:cytochrome c biogenesis protein CcdA [Treponema sp.]